MKLSKKQNGKALREYMRSKGMQRQHELALDLGLSDATISLYLNGKKSFSVRTAKRISRHTGLSLEQIFA